MPEASNRLVIGRPRPEVFEFLANAENDRRWRAAVLEIERQSPTHYRQVVAGPGGRRIDADIEIVDSEPPARLAFETVAGPVRPTGRYELAEVNGGTDLTFTLSAELRGPKRLMAPMVRRTMQKEIGALVELKRVLEAQPRG
jgi:uncharacterized protein YndB with AHSA1/START domain